MFGDVGDWCDGVEVLEVEVEVLRYYVWVYVVLGDECVVVVGEFWWFWVGFCVYCDVDVFVVPDRF